MPRRVDKILLLDHDDSFTYTIKAYFDTLGVITDVVSHHAPNLENPRRFNANYLVFSPGPGHPRAATTALAWMRSYWRDYPMLGVCLGMQCMVEAFGGEVIHAGEIMHGKQSLIYHSGEGIFLGIPQGFSATRYHSLVADPSTLPACLHVIAWTYDQQGNRVIMGIQHRDYPIYGVQYHPEAVLTEHGHAVLANFLNLAKPPI